MKKINVYILLVLVFSQTSLAQNILLGGTVYSEEDVENIHVINRTQKRYTTTDSSGRFTMPVKLRDTIVFSSIQHIPHAIVIEQKHIDTKQLEVTLDAQINKLDEVVIGRLLTGDLLSDIDNTRGKPEINFYDVGIPGYKGKPKTMNERRLQEASDLSPKAGGSLGGLGGSVSFTAILNAITGRTKKLKKRVAIETKAEFIQTLKAKFSKDLFAQNTLPEERIMEFYFFAGDDKSFIDICKTKNDLIIFEFLRKKLIEFKKNMNSKGDN